MTIKKTREDAIMQAYNEFDNGSFLKDLERRVAIPTESQVPELSDQLERYQQDEMMPCLKALGFETKLIENPIKNRGPALAASRIENPDYPSVLIYGHGDVVRSIKSEWSDGLDPYKMTIRGDKIYGRGVADNKGQHTLALTALSAVLKERNNKLGFNTKFIIETGEEQGSPGLQKMIEENTDLLKMRCFSWLRWSSKICKMHGLEFGMSGRCIF